MKQAYSRILFICIALLHVTSVLHAKKVQVLFIGNSYTYVNNLPQIIADMAASAGDTMIYDVSVAGGVSFFNHADPNQPQNGLYTLPKIRMGGWDYVVLQEQSLGTAMPTPQYNMYSYPQACQLADTIKHYNPCAETVFYMTWGRKNGLPNNCDTTWPPYCNYQAMDSVIRLRYMQMADSNRASVSPVGATWRYIRALYPSINLYDSDESHPSPAGSYAGACSFYTVFFKKPADSIQYNFSLAPADAAAIRTAAGKVVYDSMNYWHIGQYKTTADFNYALNGASVSFTNNSANAGQYNWSFGDGQTSASANPVHAYTASGTYTVRLIATGMQCRDTSYASVTVTALSVDDLAETAFTISPNPATGILYIRSDLFTKAGYRIQLLNSIGQLVLERSSGTSSIQTIDLSAIPKGFYTLKISNRQASVLKKVVVQ